jgi:hypothetical protein
MKACLTHSSPGTGRHASGVISGVPPPAAVDRTRRGSGIRPRQPAKAGQAPGKWPLVPVARPDPRPSALSWVRIAATATLSPNSSKIASERARSRLASSGSPPARVACPSTRSVCASPRRSPGPRRSSRARPRQSAAWLTSPEARYASPRLFRAYPFPADFSDLREDFPRPLQAVSSLLDAAQGQVGLAEVVQSHTLLSPRIMPAQPFLTRLSNPR